jgi:hypothetical protein
VTGLQVRPIGNFPEKRMLVENSYHSLPTGSP